MTILATGDIQQKYEIIDVVFSMSVHKAGFFDASANPQKAFDGIRSQLKQIGSNMAADAIINCQFEYRVAVSQGLLGGSQVMEIFAYGTAVKFL